MLVVKIEFWPFGDQSKAKVIGKAEIANDATSPSTDIGNYDIRIVQSGDAGRFNRKVRIEGFPRKKLGAWYLLYLALRKLFNRK
jgi:hypothetical protein